MQQVAWLDLETGECGERRLAHRGGEAEQFYRELKEKRVSVRVGMEVSRFRGGLPSLRPPCVERYEFRPSVGYQASLKFTDGTQKFGSWNAMTSCLTCGPHSISSAAMYVSRTRPSGLRS
jgi:hypothetical protein